MTLFGNRFSRSCNQVKDRPYQVRMGPKSNDLGIYKRKEGDIFSTEVQRDTVSRPVTMEAGVGVAMSQGTPGLSALTRS
jgi:hypothetical protein